ncbi:MAG: leucine-rich repeat domain-containing protein [Bacteroidales bacterium]|nr:leucine-rich repeat domain-containing protein [Bacteroidales bacterium]
MNQPIRAGRLILTLAALILCALNSSAEFCYIWYTYEGSELVYQIIYDDEGNTNTVQCKGPVNSFTNNTFISRNLIIPEEVTCEDGQIYKVTTIGNSAFKDCSSLTSVTIPNSVTYLSRFAFENCSSLTSITIGNSVTAIGSSAFEGCTSLTSVTIPNSVTEISYSAFKDCSSLTSVTIPNSVTEIYGFAFLNCSSLTSITIPNSVTEIGQSLFKGCTSLTSITIGNSVTKIDYGAFSDCTSLTSVTIPNSVTEIGYRAFEGCTSMTSITIGNSVTKIDYRAFEGCTSLKELTLPESVTKIGYDTFQESGLTELTVLNPIPPTIADSHMFKKPNPEDIALYVPEGSVELYRNTYPWSRFKSINAVDTAIEEVEVEADVAVSVCGAEIVVPEGSKIFDLKGRAMRATKLPAGVYIVRTPSGKTVKVTIAHP